MPIKDRLTALFKDTDKLDELQEIINDVTALETQLAEAKTVISEHEAKIVSLQDTNHKLFLSVTKDMGEEDELEEEKELTPEEALEKLVNTIAEKGE